MCRKTAHVKAQRGAPVGVIRHFRVDEKQGAWPGLRGGEKGRAGPDHEELYRKFQIYSNDEAPLKNSKLESSRPDLIFRVQSGSDRG